MPASCLQTSATQQWLRIQIRFFHCLISLQTDRYLLAYRSTYNAFFMDLLCVLFIFVDDKQCRFGSSTQWLFYVVATLITEVMFEKFLIHIAVYNGLNLADNGYFIVQTIIDGCSTITLIFS